MFYQFSTRRELLENPPGSPDSGDIAELFGVLRPGDRCLRYVYDAESHRSPDGGLALAADAGRPGRWLLVHSGEADFGVFGVFGPEVPADDALDAMVSDESVRVIHGWTPLNFKRRHRFFRSNLALDFHNNLVTALGIEPAPHNDPFSAVLYFGGRAAGEGRTVTLSHPLLEQYDIFEVGDSTNFPVYSWWRVRCDNLSGREEREIDKLLMVTEVIDGGHVRFNYKMGWPLSAGRVLEYTPVEPVRDVTVRNMRFEGNGGGEEHGAQPLALEYAVDCDAVGIHAIHTYWPVIMRRHNTGYETRRCSLENPVEVVVGGTGYLTQQIHCLYGSVRDCVTSNARHLNDFAGGAYCQVGDCHGDGDCHGAFVTHGQFEHDLTYVNNSGLLSFANSGPTWGSSAKRITVIRHVGCWGLAFAKISDLTLQDVTIHKTEKYERSGTLLVNADGAQLRGCRADRLVFTQRSARSERPCVVADSYFDGGIEIVREGEAAVTGEIILRDNRTGGKLL